MATTAQPKTREIGIAFSAPMLAAIVAGRKTVTRRIVKPQPTTDVRESALARFAILNMSRIQPGDTLHVKEALVRTVDRWVAYASDGKKVRVDGKNRHMRWAWKPAKLAAMYCPQWASRIRLEVVSVRAEPLQEITEAEAIAEGFAQTPGTDWNGKPCVQLTAVDNFFYLWNQINGPGSWERNPWVRRIEFRRVGNVK